MAPINASDGYGYGGYENDENYENEDEESEDENEEICDIIVTIFGQSLEFIDPLVVSHFLTENGYELSFRDASNLDAQYAHWSGVPIDESEGGTRWLEAFDFPKVGDTIEIEDETWEVSWTGVLTFKVVEI